MYRKDTALELQFPAARLNSGAGDPMWIDLSRAEAERLHVALGRYLQADSHAWPPVVSLDDAANSAQVPASVEAEPAKTAAASSEPRQWICVICGWIYDEATGDPEHGIAAGTRWEDVPDDFRCPLCDVGKSDFALVAF